MAVKVKIKGAPASVASILSGGSGSDKRDSIHGSGSTETGRKVVQEQNGFQTKFPALTFGKKVSKPPRFSPGVNKGAAGNTGHLEPFPKLRANAPNDSGRRDGVKGLRTGKDGTPIALSPINATPVQRQYLRSQQPQSGE